MDADACVQQMVDALKARTKPSGMAPAAAAAIAVPLVLGECAVLVPDASCGACAYLSCGLHPGTSTPCVSMHAHHQQQQQLDQECCLPKARAPLPKPPVHSTQANTSAFCVCTGFLLAAGFVAWWVRRRRVQHSSKKRTADLLKPHSSAQLLRTRTSGTTGTSGSGSSDRPGYVCGGHCALLCAGIAVLTRQQSMHQQADSCPHQAECSRNECQSSRVCQRAYCSSCCALC